MVVLLRMPSLDRAGPKNGEPYGVWQFKRTATMYSITKFLDGCGWAEVFCAGTPMRGAPRIAGRAGKVICLARGKAARTAKK